MPLATLLGSLERDVAAEARVLADAAAADAARIDREAEAARAQRVAQAGSASRVEYQAAADRELAAAAQHARTVTLVARAAMLERVRAAVHAELPRLLASSEVGRGLVRAALACTDGTGTLHCPPALVAIAGIMAPAGLAVVEEPALTGVAVELESGVRVDATLATLLDREWPRLACEVLALVPGGST